MLYAGQGHPVVAAGREISAYHHHMVPPSSSVGEAQVGVAARRRCSEGRIGVSQARAVAYVWVGVARSAGPHGGQRGAGFYPEVQGTLGSLKQGCGLATQVQARARRPPIRLDLKDSWRNATGNPTHTGGGGNDGPVLEASSPGESRRSPVQISSLWEPCVAVG